jgi:hypothetical protein
MVGDNNNQREDQPQVNWLVITTSPTSENLYEEL